MTFMDKASTVVDFFDAIWVLLALGTSFKMGAGEE